MLENVYRAEGPYPELDFDTSVLSAEQIYARMFPGEEFLPRAPDPEEIIIGEENEVFYLISRELSFRHFSLSLSSLGMKGFFRGKYETVFLIFSWIFVMIFPSFLKN